MFADAIMTELINLDKCIREIAVVTNHDERSSKEIETGLFFVLKSSGRKLVGRLIENQQFTGSAAV